MYNGLQRDACRGCGVTRDEIRIPDNVMQCANCGCGMIRGEVWAGNMAGENLRGICPSCREPWKEREKAS